MGGPVGQAAFQSTLPRGSDQLYADIKRQHMSISIHAPSRERLSTAWLMLTSSNFNPRSLAGATISRPNSRSRHIFQSTLPRGSDPKDTSRTTAIKLFQSTLPRGSDPALMQAALKQAISIHAPSRERPGAGYSSMDLVNISIHAPSRERRAYCRCVYHVPTDFNPRSLAGATVNIRFKQLCPGISIHAPSRERLPVLLYKLAGVLFQSTLPRGSDRTNPVFRFAVFISIHAPSRERLPKPTSRRPSL